MLPYIAIAAGAAGAARAAAATATRRDKKKIKTLVVLGSGGHTAEMLRLITDFDFDRYGPLTLVTAATDTTSRAKAERELPRAALATARWAAIPRAREVGQSFVSSVPSTLNMRSWACVHLIWTAAPELVLGERPRDLRARGRPRAVVRRGSSSSSRGAAWSLSLTGRVLGGAPLRRALARARAAVPAGRYLGRIC